MLLTMTSQGIILSRQVRSELEALGYLMLKSEMYHRIIYPETAINGLSPCITDPEGPAAKDISHIVSEIDVAL